MPGLAILLAAGGGTRFHGATHKLLAELDGRPVWRWALDHVLAAGFDRVVVVTGAVDLPHGAELANHVDFVTNPKWASGQSTSVQLGIDLARAAGAEQITIGLADQPFVTPDAWRAVADAATDCRIVVARYDARPGPHPVRLASEVWPLLPRSGDEGARTLMRQHPEWVCWVDCIGSMVDIDTVEDLEQWSSR